ncbi:glycosyltransferase [Echinicola sp. CAU 1574]|uniref:Glycosyltransferase n=1 Tax=Echinicola arenosa TaxID=2774144 RepID=A0ABR9AQ29_9BACT|nr:glycosyltransferase [Echinicola arenosa]MBD8490446.1 glycosyltransferase [Echinicola arenosa]
MKILHLIQKPQLRGAEVFAAQLAQFQMRSGHDVLLVCIFQGSDQLPFDGEIVYLNCLKKNRFWEFSGWKKIKKIINDFHPEIIQANAADTLKFSVLSKVIYKWKVPIIYRNANKMGDFIRSGWHYRFNQFLVKRIQGVISVSELCNQDFKEVFGKLSIPDCTIYNGVSTIEIDHKMFGHLPEILRGKEYVLMIGAFVEEKNHKGILPIFDQIHKSYPAQYLVLVGTGGLEQEIRNEVEGMDCRQNVIFLGNSKNVFPIIQKAQALLVPSKIEGLPGVILEAMYCKTPVLAYDVGGIGEVVRNGETGFLIPFENRKDYFLKLQELLADEGGSHLIYIDNAYTEVISSFNIEVLANSFLGFYNTVLSEIKAKG